MCVSAPVITAAHVEGRLLVMFVHFLGKPAAQAGDDASVGGRFSRDCRVDATVDDVRTQFRRRPNACPGCTGSAILSTWPLL